MEHVEQQQEVIIMALIIIPSLHHYWSEENIKIFIIVTYYKFLVYLFQLCIQKLSVEIFMYK